MSKAEKIAEMLRRYEEARETLNGPSGVRGDGGDVCLMPVTWNASYRELERCLQRMRESRESLVRCSDGEKRSPRALWWHVTERFLRPELRHMRVPVRGGKPRIPAHAELHAGAVEVGEKWARVIVCVWSPAVSEVAVDAGLEWLADSFRGEPYMPVEMVAA